MDIRFTKIRRVLIAILALNWFVAVAKLIYGFMTNSTAMSADGFHSFADGTSNIIGLIGIWVASQPKDKDHPYGHKKYETFTAIIIAILLFIISFNLIRSGIFRFFNPVIPEVTLISFIVMLSTMAVNTGVFFYERSQAKVLSSDILAADAQHTRSDILISISVVFTLIAIKMGFPVVDIIVSILIALLIAHAAFEILKKSSDVLCDRRAIDSGKIRNIVMGIEGVEGCHKIRTRGRSDDIYVDLHVLVDPGTSVGKAHELNHKIETKIKKELSSVTEIAIHIEPHKNQ